MVPDPDMYTAYRGYRITNKALGLYNISQLKPVVGWITES